MKKGSPAGWFLHSWLLGIYLIALGFQPSFVFGQEVLSTQGSSQPTLEERISGLEAYLRNEAPPLRKSDAETRSENARLPSEGIPGPGHNAWMMTSTALVLFMTLPGLALFYGGLVRKKNVLSVIAQCFGSIGAVTILWVVCGYSLVFGEGGGPFLGSLRHLLFSGVTSAPDPMYSHWVSENVFAMFQLMFAVFAPALIVGSIAERMKFSSVLLFTILWMFAVYFPLAHMYWGIDGWMNGLGNSRASIRAIDFAGGAVVHMSSGWSALILCLFVGPRKGFGRSPMPPHNLVLVALGTGMLWIGWYGFNAGSALAADKVAALAFTNTTIATAVASFVWPAIEYVRNGKPSILGFCSGAIAGLVVVTPCCGFIQSPTAILVGVLAGIVPYYFCTNVKRALRYDDALDTFGIHAIGGTLGTLLTGFFASSEVHSHFMGRAAEENGLKVLMQNGWVWVEQLKAMSITISLSIGATILIAMIVKSSIGLRPTSVVEDQGLDVSEHGESAYEY